MGWQNRREFERFISGDTLNLNGCIFPYTASKDFEWMLTVALADTWGEELGLLDNDEGLYEIENVRLRKGDVVLDAGANIGLFTAYAAHKGCKVFAVEPLPQNIKWLELVAQLNADRDYDIKIIECALSDYNGRATLANNGNDLGGGTIESDILANNMKRDKRQVNYTYTNAITIDTLAEIGVIDRLDFIKADIEGAEIAMLRGGTETIFEHKPRLSLCSYHRNTDMEELESTILDIRGDYKIINGEKKIYAY